MYKIAATAAQIAKCVLPAFHVSRVRDWCFTSFPRCLFLFCLFRSLTEFEIIGQEDSRCSWTSQERYFILLHCSSIIFSWD